MRIIIPAIAVLLLTMSCTRYDDRGDSIVEIKLDDAKTTSLMTEDVFGSVMYVPLETTNESLISEISKLKIQGNNIYIYDGSKERINIFTLDGVYKKTLMKRGRGPGEYIGMEDFDVDDKYIYISARSPLGILRYDKNTFDFIDKLGGDVIGKRLVVDNTSIYLYSGNSRQNNYKDLSVLDKETGILKGQYRDLEQGKTGWHSSGFNFSLNQNKVDGTFPFDYTIYKFSANNSQPLFSINFGANNMLPKEAPYYGRNEFMEYRDQLPEPYDKPVMGLNKLFITDKHICFSFVYLKQNNFVIYSPESKKVSFGRIDGTDNMPITGSLLYVTENDEVIMYREAYSLLSSLEYIREYNKEFTIPEELSNITPEDNPILIIYKMKDL